MASRNVNSKSPETPRRSATSPDTSRREGLWTRWVKLMRRPFLGRRGKPKKGNPNIYPLY